MPNLFKIEFVQGKTDASDYGQVKHSLVDTLTNRVIISLTVSGDKLQSVSNYSREPKRLEFEVFTTTWINENIMSGDNEHTRYISHFEVKAYRDEVLFFMGIIDTSLLSYDVSSGVLKFVCYDKIKLLSVFSDLTHYYGLTAGYEPIWILGYFLQDIQQTIPINIPYLNQFAMPSLNIPSGSPLTLVHVDYDDIRRFPDQPGGWTYSYHNSGWPAPYNGFIVDVLSNTITFVFAHKVHIKATYPSPATTKYQGRYRGRIYRYYNAICPVVSEYDAKTDWADDTQTLDNAYNEMLSWFQDNGINQSTLMSGLSGLASLDGHSYSSGHNINHYVEAQCYGNILPSKIQPGKSYETFKQEDTENLKVLQAILLLYNATIYADAAGRIIMKNKDAYSANVIDIEDNDVVSFTVKRGHQEAPDISLLEIMAGDTSHLKDLIKNNLIGFHDSKWSCEATIDQIGKYTLALQSRIQIKGVVYAIIEIERDHIKDEYKVKAWRL